MSAPLYLKLPKKLKFIFVCNKPSVSVYYINNNQHYCSLNVAEIIIQFVCQYNGFCTNSKPINRINVK